MAKNTSHKHNTAKFKKRRKFFSKKQAKQIKRLFRLGMKFLEGLWYLLRLFDRIKSFWE